MLTTLLALRLPLRLFAQTHDAWVRSEFVSIAIVRPKLYVWHHLGRKLLLSCARSHCLPIYMRRSKIASWVVTQIARSFARSQRPEKKRYELAAESNSNSLRYLQRTARITLRFLISMDTRNLVPTAVVLEDLLLRESSTSDRDQDYWQYVFDSILTPLLKLRRSDKLSKVLLCTWLRFGANERFCS